MAANIASCLLNRVLLGLLLLWPLIAARAGLEDRLADESRIPRLPPSPDWSSIDVPPADAEAAKAAVEPKAFGPMAPAAQQPLGALTGRLVFMNCGHGWTYDSAFSPPWRLLRPAPLLEMNEDYGNLDQLNMFAMYCFNAGAVVIPCRALGFQTNEVVLDNDDAGVSFSGAWTASSATNYFYGTAGDVPYRFATLTATETATATYTPTIPVTGYYPVYCWASHGGNRGDQLYRVVHTGGESQLRIPHYMVGNGWVYLGEYFFNAGSNSANGAVIISNLRSTTNGSVVIADAIRFGNGMGSIDRGGGVSDYPREDENCRYWVQAGLGVGMPTSIYDSGSSDESDSWSTPPQISAEMNRQAYGSVHKRIHISFHSNASSGSSRGAIGLITTDPTTNQAALAQICGQEVNVDLRAVGAPPLELAWSTRTTYTYSGGYSEIDGSLFNYEMPATIIEVAFHDNDSDSKLMRDAKARAAIGRAAMHAAIKYFNTYDGLALNFLPEPPSNPRAAGATNGAITLRWTAPVAVGDSGSPTNYVIYCSTNGYGFGNPISAGNVTIYTITNLAGGTDYYFRIAAANAGGESLPSEVVGCRTALTGDAPKALVVNAFDRFDRTTNLRQDVTRQSYVPPDGSGVIERVWPRRVNSFDYVVPHGKAISAFGMAFDSCQRQAATNGQVTLTSYPIVIWEAGQSLTNTFRGPERNVLSTFLAFGGSLFVSGAKIAYDLDRASGPDTAERNFLKNQLHADLASDANTNAGSYTFTAVAGSIFNGNSNGTIDNGAKGIYWVQTADVLTPYGAGATAAANYSGNTNGAAAIQYDGSAGGGKVVYCGFPFETITASARRDAYMADILGFLLAPIPPNILTQPVSLSITQGANATFTVACVGTVPLRYQWRFNGTNITDATATAYTRSNALPSHAGDYAVVVTNTGGAITSSVAALTVIPRQPPVFDQAVLLPGQIKLVVSGIPGTYAIYTSPDLTAWSFWTNVAIAGPPVEVLDDSVTAETQRFYRAQPSP
jgi:hypothetical protein